MGELVSDFGEFGLSGEWSVVLRGPKSDEHEAHEECSLWGE